MSETPEQSQTTQTTQTQSQTQTIQQINTKVFYVMHNDDFSSKHLQPVIVLYNGKVYNIFMKQRIGRPDMYYIPGERIYVKLWRDYKGHILVYISSVYKNNMFFTRDIDIIQVNENIIYEYDMRRLRCPGKDILLKAFDVVKAIDEIEPELLPPLFALICYRLL